jgi:hypothetical protein
VANASMQFLLKQSPTAVDVLTDVFKLTSEEKKRLSQFPVGQGLFFAGQNHVHIQVIASPTENELIVTTPAPAQLQPQAAPLSGAAAQTPAPASAPPTVQNLEAANEPPPDSQSLGGEPAPQPQANGANPEWQRQSTS